jgi:hypothetical protein
MSGSSRLAVLERLLGGASPATVWSAAPRRRGSTVPELLRHALVRELRLAGLHVIPRRGGLDRIHVVRVPADAGRSRRSAAMAWLRGGAVAAVAYAGTETIMDQLLLDAALSGAGGISVGRDGSVLLRTSRRDGLPVVVRVGVGAADPRPPAEVLRELALTDPTIPRIVDVGATAALGWTVETRLPGHRPDVVDAAVVSQVSEVLLRLPRHDAPPTSWRDDLAMLAGTVPSAAAAATTLQEELHPVLRSLPSVVRHGDLWRGNLVVAGGRLRGLVDWDAIHTSGTPGVDLLQLLTTELRGRGRGLGTVFQSSPWRDADVRGPVVGHLRRHGVDPDERLLEALAACWWAQEVAGTLRRLPDRAADRRWWEPNVRDVLRALGGDPGRIGPGPALAP